jgi:hypothetical protein
MLQTKRKLNTKKVGKTNKPEMKDLFTLGWEIPFAEGPLLHYTGCISCSVRVLDFEMFVPFLIVPETNFSMNCPVVIGTNIIRVCKDHWSYISYYRPKTWQTALNSKAFKSFCIRTAAKKEKTVPPY